MTRALLIGKEPAAELGYDFVTEPPYDAVVIGSLTLSQLLRFREEQVLSALAREGDMSVTEISKRFGIAKPNITPLIDHLTDAGWVERTKNNRDRRVVNVTILPEGREKGERALEAMRERVAKWKNGLTEEEFTELQQALKSVVRILGKL